jgi:PPM family protein phosphatase
VLVIVVLGGGYAAWRYTQTQYYVGTDGSQVIIYRGINQKVLGMSLSSVYQKTGIPLSHVPSTDLAQVQSTIPAASLADARKAVGNIRQTYACDHYATTYASWVAHKPKPVKVTRKVGGKTVTTTKTAPYGPAPKAPKGCPPQGSTG